MNARSRPGFLSLLTIWMVMALPVGCGAPAATPVEVDEATWDRFEAKWWSL
jgi:hypothetical protein